MKIDRNISDTIQRIMQATILYNKTIHSVIGEKPLDVLYEANEESTRAISDKIAKVQQTQLARCNASRQNKVFEAQHDTCARGLHAVGAVDCKTQPSQLEMIHVVDEGMIIINEQRASVRTDGGPEVNILGTHLITFEHQAMVNGTRYVNHNEELR